MLDIKKLKFYSWSLRFSENSVFSSLENKFFNNYFFFMANLRVYPSFGYFHYTRDLVDCTLRFLSTNSGFFIYDEEDYLAKRDLTSMKDCERVLFRGLYYLFVFWYWVPVCFSDLKQYYPDFNVIFGEEELVVLDYWIEVLPIFEDFLGHLLINDTPFIKAFDPIIEISPYVSKAFITMKVPLPELIEDVPGYLEEYYFGEGSHPYFLPLITFYLERRPLIKELCLKAFVEDKALNKKISDNLSIYFICNFLIKNLSKNTLKFILANLPLTEKNPLKKFQLCDKLFYDSFTSEMRAFYLATEQKHLNDFIDQRKKRIN